MWTTSWLPKEAKMASSKSGESFQWDSDASRRFKLHKRGQLFIRAHNEALPIAAMRISDPDRSPAGINC
jgi:hypothetical protein